MTPGVLQAWLGGTMMGTTATRQRARDDECECAKWAKKKTKKGVVVPL